MRISSARMLHGISPPMTRQPSTGDTGWFVGCSSLRAMRRIFPLPAGATAADPAAAVLPVVAGAVEFVAGAFVAAWLFPRLGVHIGSGILSEIIFSALGAIILLLIVRLIRGRGRI